MKVHLGLWATCLLGCALDTGASELELPLQVAGTHVPSDFAGRDGARITLDEAQLAFGPLYVCRGVQAGETCETAALEWLDAVVVDALAPAFVEVGSLQGQSGTIRSWMYDLGFHSRLTQARPLVLEAARELDDNSVRLAGEVRVQGQRLPFVAEVAVMAGAGTEQGVPLVKSANPSGYARTLQDDGGRLRVRFDPRPWLSDVDFAAYVDTRECDDSSAPPFVCEGTRQVPCAEDGTPLPALDCADVGQVCLPDSGCEDAIVVAPESQAWRAIRNALVAGERPQFRWRE